MPRTIPISQVVITAAPLPHSFRLVLFNDTSVEDAFDTTMPLNKLRALIEGTLEKPYDLLTTYKLCEVAKP